MDEDEEDDSYYDDDDDEIGYDTNFSIVDAKGAILIDRFKQSCFGSMSASDTNINGEIRYYIPKTHFDNPSTNNTYVNIIRDEEKLKAWLSIINRIFYLSDKEKLKYVNQERERFQSYISIPIDTTSFQKYKLLLCTLARVAIEENKPLAAIEIMKFIEGKKGYMWQNFFDAIFDIYARTGSFNGSDYSKNLYNPIADGHGFCPAYMGLFVEPKYSKENFRGEAPRKINMVYDFLTHNKIVKNSPSIDFGSFANELKQLYLTDKKEYFKYAKKADEAIRGGRATLQGLRKLVGK